MLFLLRFFRGYLSVAFMGDNAEKILNLCAENKLHIWDMYYKNGCIYTMIDIPSFLSLRKLKRGIKIIIKILEKRGLPFFLKKYKNRIGIVSGIAVFFIIIKLMSLFIWGINIKGNENIKSYEIINECEDLGIKEGVLKNKINPKNDAQRLMLSDGRMAWASLNIEGCVLTVNITEIKSEKGEKNMPSNIKAKTDGIITKISATSGNVIVKQGDTVAKGDILISGITEMINSTVLNRSIGNIEAKTIREFHSYEPFVQKKKIYSKKAKNKSIVKLYSLNIPLYIGKIGDVQILSKFNKSLSISGNRIPIEIYKVKCKKYEEFNVKVSEDLLKNKLSKEIDKQLESYNPISYNLIEEKYTNENDGISLFRRYEFIENIGFEERLNINSPN